MKVRSLAYLTTFENELAFDFSGKTGLDILCLFIGAVMLMEKWRFCSGVTKVRSSSWLIIQNVLAHSFQVGSDKSVWINSSWLIHQESSNDCQRNSQEIHTKRQAVWRWCLSSCGFFSDFKEPSWEKRLHWGCYYIFYSLFFFFFFKGTFPYQK